MARNDRHGPPDLGGGRVLGAQAMAATDVRFVPGLNLAVIDQVAGVKLSRPCLQVVDLSNGHAMITPVDARWMRQFADQLARAADAAESLEGVGSAGSQSLAGV